MDATELAKLNADIDRLTFDLGRLDATPVATEPPREFRRIVLAVDGSRESDQAIAWAADIAARNGARVWVVHVLPVPGVLAFYQSLPGGDPVGPYVDVVRAHGQDVVETARAALAKSGVASEGIVLPGWPTRAIVEVVREKRADLVIVGDHGRGRGERFILGSVADGVKNHAPASVLIAKGPPSSTRVILAVDGSSASKRAAAVGLSLAHGSRSRATALHVVPDAPYGSVEGTGDHREVAAALAHLGLPPDDARVDYALLTGSPARTIAAFARERGCGLIVLGASGLTGLRALAPGGVANRVAHEAHASVLLVKEASP